MKQKMMVMSTKMMKDNLETSMSKNMERCMKEVREMRGDLKDEIQEVKSDAIKLENKVEDLEQNMKDAEQSKMDMEDTLKA